MNLESRLQRLEKMDAQKSHEYASWCELDVVGNIVKTESNKPIRPAGFCKEYVGASPADWPDPLMP